VSLAPLGISLERVVKRFGPEIALLDIDLEIPQGSYVAVMGPNGAGKTTLLKVIAGLARPTSGHVSLAGVRLSDAGPGLRALVGFLGHESMLYPDLTGLENLMFHARLHRLAEPRKAALETAGLLEVETDLSRPVGSLSRGMRQRVAIARAVIHQPRVLLMDEPYTGLDEHAAASLASLLQRLHTPERTVVVTIHEISRALAGPERIVALAGGRIAMDVTTFEEHERISGEYLSLLARGGER
jgi:ABC-type multidrug transport system ATPase subunit